MATGPEPIQLNWHQTSNSTVKGKINGLEETVRVLTDEFNFYANEIWSLRGVKELQEQNFAARLSERRLK